MLPRIQVCKPWSTFSVQLDIFRKLWSAVVSRTSVPNALLILTEQTIPPKQGLGLESWSDTVMNGQLYSYM